MAWGDASRQPPSNRPLAIDLFTGLHGWASGLIAAGFDVMGFDLEDMSAQFGQPKPEHFQLVLQDVRTLHGSQFRQASLIVASPPCQRYSWMAMPWSAAKAKAAEIRADASGKMLEDLNLLFNECFRIQREACEAAGRHIPLIVENVKGAQPWVGPARWNSGAFHFWGDTPALFPAISPRKGEGSGRSWFYRNGGNGRSASSASVERAAWSASVAKIPFPLARHIGMVFHG